MAISVAGLTVHNQDGSGTWDDIGGGQGSSQTTVAFFSSTGARGRKFSGDRGMLAPVAIADFVNTVVQVRYQLVGGFAATISAGGGAIRLQDTGGNWSEYYVSGSDAYKGGWATASISTTRTPSATSGGGANLSSIAFAGMRFNASGGSGGDPNCYIDQVVSFPDNGLTISGDSNNLVADLIDWDAVSDYGVIDQRDGFAFSIASLTLSPNASGFSSSDEFLVFSDPLYSDGTNTQSALVNAKLTSSSGNPITLTRLSCTAFDDTAKTGTLEVQRAVDFQTATAVTVDSGSFTGFDATADPFRLGGSTNSYAGTSFNSCGKVTEAGATLTGVFFRTPTDPTGAFVYPFDDSGIDGLTFVSDGTGHGVEMIEAGASARTIANLDFQNFGADDTADAAIGYTGTSAFELNVSAGTTAPTVDPTSLVTVVSSVPIEITVRDALTLTAIPNARVYAHDDAFNSIISGITDAVGVISVAYTDAVPAAIKGWARDYDLTGTDYEVGEFAGTITTTGFSTTINLERE